MTTPTGLAPGSPWMRVVSVAYLVLAPDVPVAETDAAAAPWVPVSEVGALAFDHAQILTEGGESALRSAPHGESPSALRSSGLRNCGGSTRSCGAGTGPRNFHRKVTDVGGCSIPPGRRPPGTAAVLRSGREPPLPCIRPRSGLTPSNGVSSPHGRDNSFSHRSPVDHHRALSVEGAHRFEGPRKGHVQQAPRCAAHQLNG